MKQQKTKEQELSDGFKDGMKKEEKYPDKAIEYLNKCFPKGNKKRGEAMCLLAITLWEGKEMGKQEAKQDEIRLINKFYSDLSDIINSLRDDLKLDCTGEEGYRNKRKGYNAVRRYTEKLVYRVLNKWKVELKRLQELKGK